MSSLSACRSCLAPGLVPVLSLGCTPLANSLLTEEQLGQPEPVYPLELVFCPTCALIQLTETIPPERLFRNYAYLSSFSDTMLAHAETLVRHLLAERGLDGSSLVLEVASNDGYLLQYYRQAGVPVLGIEPAENAARVARERGVDTLCEFFGEQLAARLAGDGIRADVLHAHNVLAHVPDLNGFMRAVRAVLKENGVAVVEAPYVKDMLDAIEFDTIYHEHVFYFSLSTLEHLSRRNGLIIRHVQRLPIHGGSLRLFLAPAECGAAPSPTVTRMLEEERQWGVHRAEAYVGFGREIERLRSELLELLTRLKTEGHRIAAYGASAKGSTLLNYFDIGLETLDFVADRSTTKQGRYTPGKHLKILPPAALLEEQPDFVLLLTWNFAEEILAQQAEYRRRGGRFIIPLPRVEVV